MDRFLKKKPSSSDGSPSDQWKSILGLGKGYQKEVVKDMMIDLTLWEDRSHLVAGSKAKGIIKMSCVCPRPKEMCSKKGRRIQWNAKAGYTNPFKHLVSLCMILFSLFC